MIKTDKVKLAELAKIHIAKKELGLEDDTYRALLRRVIDLNPAHLTALGKTKAFEGVISAKYLTVLGRAAVLEHLKASGFTGKAAYPASRITPTAKRQAQRRNCARLKPCWPRQADRGRMRPPWLSTCTKKRSLNFATVRNWRD